MHDIVCALTIPSNRPHGMAHGILDLDDTDPSANHDTPRWPKDCQDDGQNLSARYPTHRFLLQLEFDLR